MATIADLVTSEIWDEAAAVRLLDENPLCFVGANLMSQLCALPYNEDRTAFMCARWPEALYVGTRAHTTPVLGAIREDNAQLLKHFIEFDSRIINFYHRTGKNLLAKATKKHYSRKTEVLRYLLTEQIQAFEDNGGIFDLLRLTYRMNQQGADFIKEFVIPRLHLPVYCTPMTWSVLWHDYNHCRYTKFPCAHLVTEVYERQNGCAYMKNFNFIAMCRPSFETLFMLEHKRGGARCHKVAVKCIRAKRYPRGKRMDCIDWIARATGAAYLRYCSAEGYTILHYLALKKRTRYGELIKVVVAARPSLLFEPNHEGMLPVEYNHACGSAKLLADEMCARPREMMACTPSTKRIDVLTKRFDEVLPHAKTPEEFTWLFDMMVVSVRQWLAVARRCPSLFFAHCVNGRTFFYAALMYGDTKCITAYVKTVQFIKRVSSYPNGTCFGANYATQRYFDLLNENCRSAAWEKHIGPTSMLFMLHVARFIKRL